MVVLVGMINNSKFKPESSYVVTHRRVLINSNCSQAFFLEDAIMRKIDLTGKRFGRWVVIKENGRSKRGGVLWECICDCGKIVTVHGGNLKNATTRSCGCFAKEQAKIAHTTHGMKGTPVYTTWTLMNNRCINVNDEHYKYYGERGIKVCEKWRNSFENFFEDMGDRPIGKTIERIDNNLGYFKENCCWADSKTQNRNSRNTRLIEYNGEVKCLTEWANELNINYGTLHSRLYNYPPEVAFNM